METGKTGRKRGQKNHQLIQAAVVCLATVSLFTTAQGMDKYIFDNTPISFAASAAIQGILLAMSMGLPTYIDDVFKNQWNVLRKILVAFSIVILTLVALICSSWFSYIYIAEKVHFDSWNTESELLVQQTYREELYNAKDYAHAYRVYLENSLGEKIIELEEIADELEENEQLEALEVEWQAKREEYEKENTLVASYMLPVLDVMDKAMQKNPSQNSREQAARAIEDAKNNINNSKEIIEQRLAEINGNIDSYSTRITNYTNQINHATEGTDIPSLQAALNNTSELLQKETENQSNLLTEYDQLNDALSKLQIYETYLGLNESTSTITIKTQLLEMQTEFFAENPDEEALLGTAESIFKSLRNASTYEEGDKLSYSNLLVQMNQLILNLKDYSVIKKTEAQLDSYINEFALEEEVGKTAETEEAQEVETKGTEETPGEEETEAGTKEITGEEGTEAGASTEETTVEEGTEAGTSTEETTEEEGTEAGTSTEETTEEEETEAETKETIGEEGEKTEETKETEAKKIKDDSWKKKWNGQLEELKSVISAMPVYTEVADSTNETNSLTDLQREVLQRYSRNEASNRLDDMIRFYVADHNALYQGIIYLRSPYNELAWFAFVLAFSFDIAGFILGFVNQGDIENRTADEDENRDDKDNGKNGNMDNTAEWSILPTLHKYRVLTGDYEKKDGVYSYQVFEDGLLQIWKVDDTAPYKQGIYKQYSTVETKGMQVPETQKEVLFHGQAGGPQDGVYLDCSLKFNEGSLLFVEEENKKISERFLVNLYEYVPVHSYSCSRGESRTIPVQDLAKNNFEAKMAVLALNDKGSRVVAIYVVED